MVQLLQPLLKSAQIELALVLDIQSAPEGFDARILSICALGVHRLARLSEIYHGWRVRRAGEGGSADIEGEGWCGSGVKRRGAMKVA